MPSKGSERNNKSKDDRCVGQWWGKSGAVKGREEQRDETRTLKFNKRTSLRRRTPLKLKVRERRKR